MNLNNVGDRVRDSLWRYGCGFVLKSVQRHVWNFVDESIEDCVMVSVWDSVESSMEFNFSALENQETV